MRGPSTQSPTGLIIVWAVLSTLSMPAYVQKQPIRTKHGIVASSSTPANLPSNGADTRHPVAINQQQRPANHDGCIKYRVELLSQHALAGGLPAAEHFQIAPLLGLLLEVIAKVMNPTESRLHLPNPPAPFPAHANEKAVCVREGGESMLNIPPSLRGTRELGNGVKCKRGNYKCHESNRIESSFA